MKFKSPKLTKFDYYTISVFIIGFALAAADFSILDLYTELFSYIAGLFFWSLYFLTSVFLFFSARQVIKHNAMYRITSWDNPELYQKTIMLFFIAYFIGFLINLENAFILNVFSNILHTPL